ncbi:MAG: 1-deoxy-D-xylulose-5-phosphate synthase [Limibacillus sp.]
MSERLLGGIHSPEDLRRLPRERLAQVVDEIRAEIVQKVSRTGGHLASSLGSVELLVAIHAVFDTPSDRLVLDVGHQGYPHKMLTGRREAFDRIGKSDGIAKFLRRSESPYDHFGAGHAGTSISAALGIARALQHQEREGCAIALIGDGGMTAGMAFEALNHAGHLRQRNLVVVLNDNEMSISPNVGALSSYLSRKLSMPLVRRMKGLARELLSSMPGDMLHWAHKAEESLKVLFSPGMLFEALSFRYVGPIQGNRLDVVLETFANVRQMILSGEGPILVHAVTAKGYGYEPAQQDPYRYHGVGAFDVESGRFRPARPGPPRYQDVFADTLIRLAREDPRIVGITAAMADGTGLDRFREVFPDRFYDVGIAEQHAVTFAAGMSCMGLKPFVAIYSTFLQRAYDQIVHDVAIQSLPVRFAIDRAGMVGADGVTHQGSYDITYLGCLPGMVLMAAADEAELMHMVATAAQINDRPSALRYPRGEGTAKVELPARGTPLEIGKGRILQEGSRVAVLSYGTRLAEALAAAEMLGAKGLSTTVADARFAKPLDEELIRRLAAEHEVLITVEEGAVGGFGSHVGHFLAWDGLLDGQLKFRPLCLPDFFIDHDKPEKQYEQAGLTARHIAAAALQSLGYNEPEVESETSGQRA